MSLDPSSSSQPALCPNCGAALPARALQGLCPKCLFAGLAVPTEDGANAASPAPAQAPEELAPHFPQLEILECLGRGGMGVVYKARQRSLNRFVALKLLAPERVEDVKFAQRFTHEAQALATLNHPNIVTIHDFGQAGGFYFLLMEFVDGVNLRQAMKAGRFTPEQALAVVPPVCEALQYAHEHGIVHRDIKPENLLLDKEGRVKIADFGIAKMLGSDSGVAARDEELQTGTLASAAGTPQYMAPEQKEHRVCDHRADIYSLGVVLYELLTGELPADKLQAPSSRLRGLQIDVRLDEIVLRALEKTPELRYQTAGEFRTQVETMTSSPNGPPAEPSVAAVPLRFSRTAIVGACWAAVGLLAVIWLKLIEGEHVGQWSSMTGPEKLGFLLTEMLFLFGLPAILGTTILGWIAVRQICRSTGTLRGMGLAVFDGLFFPLVVLDAVIARLWVRVVWWFIAHYTQDGVLAQPASDPNLGNLITNQLQHTTVTIALLVAGITAAAVDYFIIRAVWGAVRGPSGLPMRKSALGKKALFAGILAAVVCLIIAISGFGVVRVSPPPPGFEPVVERVVVNMIDFDTGELADLPLPTQPGETDEARFDWLNGPDARRPNKESHPWMRARGIDAIDANHALYGVDLRPVALDPSDWPSLTPAALEEKVLTWPHSPYSINAFASSTVTNTYGFQTREGRFGILQITDRNLPRGVKIRYRLAQVAAIEAAHVSAMKETWSPTLAPGAKPDLQAILTEAHAFTGNGRYEEALQRHLWFHHHALGFGPAFSGVRLSFALEYWAELGQHYPKATLALIEIRDRGTRELVGGRGDFALFMEVDAINRTLRDNNATDTLFKTMQTVNQALAHQCYPLMEERLMERGEYEACLGYIGDPFARYESIHSVFEVTQTLPDTIPASQQDQIRDHVKRTFVTDTCRLIEILVATKRQADAEKIRDQAVAALNDSRLKSAVADAEERIRRKMVAPAATPQASKAPAPEEGWRERFEAVYRLKDGELVKHIRPPYVPERTEFYRNEESLHHQAEVAPEPPNSFFFHQNEQGLHNWGYSFIGSDRTTLYDVLRHVFDLKRYEMEGSAVLLKLSLEGDWTIREGTETKALMEALATALRTETKRNIRFEKRAVEREVIVARGPARTVSGSDRSILIYAENPKDKGAGGGSGDMSKFLAHVGDELGVPMVNEVTGGEQKELAWENRADANFASMDARLDELTARVLENLTEQTGITFTREKRPFETWFVTEQQ